MLVVAAFASLRDRSTNRSNSPLMLRCCFTATETVGLLGTGAQDVHLDFHTAPELWIPRLSIFLSKNPLFPFTPMMCDRLKDRRGINGKKKQKRSISVEYGDIKAGGDRESGEVFMGR